MKKEVKELLIDLVEHYNTTIPNGRSAFQMLGALAKRASALIKAEEEKKNQTTNKVDPYDLPYHDTESPLPQQGQLPLKMEGDW